VIASRPVTHRATWPQRIATLFRRDIPLALLDLCIVVVAYMLPLVVRFNGHVPMSYWENFWKFIPVAAFLHIATNYFVGLYGQMWRYASVQEARRVVLASVTAGALIFGIAVIVGGAKTPIPMSVLVLGPALSLLGFGGIRFQSRLFALRRGASDAKRVRVLLVGAGDAGAALLNDLLVHGSLGLDPVGFVDDDPRKVGRSLRGVPVLGTRAAIPSLVERLGIRQVLLAIPSATSDVVRDIATLCEDAEVTLRVLPSVNEIVNGHVSARDIRDLRIEDLLGRQQVETDLDAVRHLLRDRRVLVTGAGGSIGAEIAHQVASFEPAALVVLDHDETHLHDLVTELGGGKNVRPVLADIRDRDRILRTFTDHRPHVVFHAAAHKHVPILEDHPGEAIATNIRGTLSVVDAAAAVDTERFVLISTDKAIRPTSVMGASKWFAEQIVWSRARNGYVFSSVRFGNVLGSRGSVIPTFFRQIQRGGPVTVTDPSMARYFMSVAEAVQLVLQAATLADGGEVFTLEMGDPINILDLARKLIRLSGHVPDRDVRIDVVGMRPGEKLVEDIIDEGEAPAPTRHPAILVSRPAPPDDTALVWAMERLEILGEDDEGKAGDELKRLAREGLEVSEAPSALVVHR
jgi:FlaA1/EpsC-like NDP-sugar epimerase